MNGMTRGILAATLLLVGTAITAAGDDAAIQSFRKDGKAAALTVVPTRVAGTAIPKVGEVVALMLERGGMTNLETSAAAFTPADGADLAKAANGFGEFIRTNPVSTEYALFTEFIGTREAGITEVRSIVVNRRGDVVWTDKQAKGDADFDRIKPREPMQGCMLVAERLRPVLKLDDSSNGEGHQGKLAERWRKSTGVPEKAELQAIEKRGAAFKKAAAGATLTVYPAHAGDSFSGESATSIAARLNELKLTKASAASQGPELKVAGDMNEQKVLWAMAHAFSEYVQKNPPTSDYVIYADYLMGKDFVGGVHFAICNQKGELVVVDFQNSHQPDFQAIHPKSREDCDKLIVKRLQGYCK